MLLWLGIPLGGLGTADARESTDVSASVAAAKVRPAKAASFRSQAHRLEPGMATPLHAKPLLGPFADKAAADVQGCESPTTLSKLKTPYVSVETCAHKDSTALVIGTAHGLFLLPDFFARTASAVNRIGNVRIEQSRLLLESVSTEGRFASLSSSFLTVCADSASGLSCVGPLEVGRVFVGYEGGKEDGHRLPPQTRFEYRFRFLPDDVLSLEPVVKPVSADLAGLHKLRFP